MGETMLDCRQIDELLSGYLDSELTQGERQRVEVHLEDCTACRKKYNEMADLRRAVGKVSFGEMSPQQRSKIMNDLTVRTSRGLGWLLYLLGVIVVVGYGAYSFAIDDQVSALEKTGVTGIVVGGILLLISVARQRMIARQTDKYKDVEI